MKLPSLNATGKLHSEKIIMKDVSINGHCGQLR